MKFYKALEEHEKEQDKEQEKEQDKEQDKDQEKEQETDQKKDPEVELSLIYAGVGAATVALLCIVIAYIYFKKKS